MTTHRIGIIADSTRTRPYGHNIHTAWNGLPNVEVVALADPDATVHAARAAECHAARTYTDYRAMLAAEHPDFVSICPHYYDLHAQWMLDAIAAGVKGIYIEKPMTRTLAEADAVIAAAERSGAKIAVAHQWGRFRHSVVAARQWIHDGRIGELRQLRGHGKCDARGGAHDLFVLGTHVLDLMRSIAGDVAWATGHVRKAGREVTVEDIGDGAEGIGPLAGDAVQGCYAFRSGVTASFESYVHPAGAVETVGLEVWGTEGAISIRNGGQEIAVYPKPALRPADGTPQWETYAIPILGRDGTALQGAAGGHRLNQLAVEDLIAAWEHGREPYASARAATAALEMAMAIFEGERTQRRVSFPMTTRENPFAVWRASGRA